MEIKTNQALAQAVSEGAKPNRLCPFAYVSCYFFVFTLFAFDQPEQYVWPFTTLYVRTLT